MDSPWYKSQTFSAMVLTIITLACNALGRKFGVELNATEIAGLVATVVAFIAGRQWKSTKLALAAPAMTPPATGAEAAKVATAPATP